MVKKIETHWIILGVIALIAIMYFATGGFQFAAVPGVPGVPGIAPGYATTIRTSGYDPIAGSLVATNAELRASDGTTIVGATSIPSALTSLTTSGANTFDGFVYIGNDNLESGWTDRGTEYYINKKAVSWVNKAGDISFERISTYAEATPTFTGYDDGTAETTLNVSVGSGSTVTTTELRMEPSSNAVLGNPIFTRPLAVCFNESTTGLFEEIRPSQYDEIIPAPGFMSGRNVIKSQCYVLPTSALYEGVSGQPQFYRFYIRIEAKSGTDPVPGNDVHTVLLDKSYYLDDNQNWVEGWGAEHVQTSDHDVAMASIGNTKIIYFT